MKWVALYLLVGIIFQWMSEFDIKKNHPEIYSRFKYRLLDAIIGILFWPFIGLLGLMVGVKIAIDIANDPWAKQSDLEGEIESRITKWFEEHFAWYFKDKE